MSSVLMVPSSALSSASQLVIELISLHQASSADVDGWCYHRVGIEAMPHSLADPSLLQTEDMLGRSAEDVATFLAKTDGLDKTLIGDYLGEREDFNLKVMHAFVDALDFSGLEFDTAIRTFLQVRSRRRGWREKGHIARGRGGRRRLRGRMHAEVLSRPTCRTLGGEWLLAEREHSCAAMYDTLVVCV